jgi:hypothetical protein
MVDDMNKLDQKARAQILHLLCEGNSIRAVTRLTGASKKAVSRLLVDAGQAASWYQDRVFRNLTCKRVQVDELWSFVHCKQKNVAGAKKAPHHAGDCWTWTAIDAEALRNIPVNEENVRKFKELQMCNRHGLVVPIDAQHM